MTGKRFETNQYIGVCYQGFIQRESLFLGGGGGGEAPGNGCGFIYFSIQLSQIFGGKLPPHPPPPPLDETLVIIDFYYHIHPKNNFIDKLAKHCLFS